MDITHNQRHTQADLRLSPVTGELLDEAEAAADVAFMFTSTEEFSEKPFGFVFLHDLKHYYLGTEYWLIPETMTNNITVNIFIIIEDN